MRAAFEYRLSRDEYVAGLRALMVELARQDRSMEKRTLANLAAPVVIILLVVYFLPEALLGLLLGTLLLGLVQIAVVRWNGIGQSYDPAAADLKVEFTDQGIVETSPGRQRRWDWSAVRRVSDLGSILMIEVVGWDMVVLPCRLFSPNEGKAGFLADLRAHLPDDAVAVVSNSPASPDHPQIILLGSIGLVVDIAFLASFAPFIIRFLESLGEGIGLAGGLIIVALVMMVVGYPIYQLTRRGLSKLHRNRPRTAIGLAQLFSWSIPAYILLVATGLA